MLNVNEFWHILLAIIILGFVEGASFRPLTYLVFLTSILFMAIVILINIFAKKLMAYYLDSTIETKIWHFKRYGYPAGYHFKKPVPIGLILPILLSVLSLGAIKWFAALEFEVEPLKHRVSKRHGFFSFSEMTDFHVALIAATGVVFNLIASIIFYIAGLSELARLNIFFAVFSMVPLSNLDGTKIFFGSLVMWSTLAVICLIFLAYALITGSVI